VTKIRGEGWTDRVELTMIRTINHAGKACFIFKQGGILNDSSEIRFRNEAIFILI